MAHNDWHEVTYPCGHTNIVRAYDCAEPRPDMDADRFELGDAIDPNTDEHGMIRTPGQWPTGGAL